MDRLTAWCVAWVRRFMPDPFVYAALLTLLAAGGALLAGPGAGLAADWPGSLLGAWSGGLFKILEFAMQMALVLVAGHALAAAPVVERGLAALARLPRTPGQALGLTVAVSMLGCFLNWGFGLVVAGLLARQMARTVPGLDYGLTVAAAYSGFVVWASGLSSSIALSSATAGSSVNFIEKATGHTAPLSATVLAPFNLVPVAVLLVLLPLVFSRLTPARVTAAPPPPEVPVEAPSDGVAGWLEQLPSTGALGLLGALALAWRASQGKLAPDLNTVIFAFLSLGMLLQPRPKPYLRAWNDAARSVGPLLLQYPLYGGILGLLSGSALVERLAALTFALSSRHTFALGVFLSSNAISLFVPSGGGHWAVQGPIVLPAALQLGVSPAVAAMAVAMGEQTANMIQPFWALPLLAIAGLGVRDIMGYCVLTFLISLAVFGGALVLLG